MFECHGLARQCLFQKLTPGPVCATPSYGLASGFIMFHTTLYRCYHQVDCRKFCRNWDCNLVAWVGTGHRASAHDPTCSHYKCVKYLVYDFLSGLALVGTGHRATAHDPTCSHYKCAKYLVYDFPFRPHFVLVIQHAVTTNARNTLSMTFLSGLVPFTRTSVLVSFLPSAPKLLVPTMLFKLWKSLRSFLAVLLQFEFAAKMLISFHGGLCSNRATDCC